MRPKQEFGTSVDVPLVKGGESRHVTVSNKDEYAQLWAQNVLRGELPYHNVECFLNRIKTKYQTSYTLLRFSSILVFLVPGPVLPFQVKSKQVTFYTVRYTVLGIFQSALHFTSWLTCSIHHHLDFTGKNPATLQLIRLLVVHNYPSLSIIRN